MVHRHINGTIRDTGPFLLPAFLLALALPVAFGLTSGVWDVAHGTRIPADVRAALYGPPGPAPPRQVPRSGQSAHPALDLNGRRG
jgi:hypothetical protein